MIRISGLNKSFGAQVLFRDADFRANLGERVAVVGPNGSGKTTLFEMIAGTTDPDSGSIQIQRGAVLGYLKQETDELRGRSVLEEVLTAGSAAAEAGARLEELTTALALQPHDAALLEEYATVQHHFEALGGYQLESEAKRILSGLGFRDTDMQRQTDALSGGWLMRVALAKMLLSHPDLLLLDEPTNHLDVESVAWLEEFLRDYDGTVLLISHDRDFMNAFANRVVEIDNAKLETYSGNYAAFVEQRKARIEAALAAAANQQRRIAQLEVFINRFRYKNTKARQVQSKIKMLDKMERVEVRKERKRRMGIAFPSPPRPGRVVAELNGVSFAYGDTKVYDQINVAIERGEKVALVGPNGAGKTTMLKLFAGALTPQHGERALGHNVDVGYFAQHQIEALDPRNRVIEELRTAIPPHLNLDARSLLGRFLFSGDDIDKPVSVLSGGERSRLALAKLLIEPHNFLCLDEPTNHLDVESRDVLEDALEDSEAAIVLITHDRHLIRSIATRIIEITPGHIANHIGDYESYLWKREQSQMAPPVAVPRTASTDKERRRLEAQSRAAAKKERDALRDVERAIEQQQASLKALEAQLADPAFYNAGDGVAEAVRAYEEGRKRLSDLEDRWTQMAEAAER